MKPLLCSILVALSPLMAAEGYIKVKATPSRAGVFIDGKYMGPAGNLGMARRYAVAEGEHELKLVEPRCEDVTRKVTVVAGKTVSVSETLPRLPEPKGPFGTLRTPIPDKYAPVYVNGKYMGHADEFNAGRQGLLLPAGTYDVRVVPHGGSPIEKKVTIEAGKTVLVQ